MTAGILPSVFLVSCSVLVFELTAVRLFSVLLRYHYVFAVVSFGILGLGIGALLAQRWRNDRAVAWTATGCGLSQPLTLAAIFNLPLPAGWWSVCVLLLPPFCLAGWFLAAVSARWPQQSGRLYGADLCGAAVGCVASLALMNLAGPVQAMLTGALLASLAGMIVSRRWAMLASGCLIVLAMAGQARWPIFQVERVRLGGDSATTKPLWRQLRQDPRKWKILASAWDAYARTDVVAGPDPDLRLVYTDGDTPTQMLRAGGRFSSPYLLRQLIGFTPYAVWPGRASDRLLCLGSGGGLDVQLGRLADIGDIVAVDVNRALPALMAQSREYHGDVYGSDGSLLQVDEGRHFLRRQREPFDVIYLALTQSATAGGTGLALTESYIHTVDAFVDALHRLTPDGRLVLVFEQESSLHRGFLTALQALQRLEGTVPSVPLHVAALSMSDDRFAPYNHLLIVKRSALTPVEINALKDAAQARALRVQFLPGEPATDPILAAISGSPLNLLPLGDDNPFFFDLTFGVPPAMVILMAVAGLATLGLIVAPTSVASVRSIGFLVAMLGIGFMMAQNVLVQRLMLALGHPTVSLAVIVFGMLLGGAAGSFLAQRLIQQNRRSSVARYAAWLIPALLLTNYALPAVVRAGTGLPLGVRVAGALAWVMPVGLLMGLFFPTALRLAGERSQAIPVLWAINGAASVLGGAAAIALAKVVSFTLALNVAVVVYAIAAVLLRLETGRSPVSLLRVNR